MPDLETPIEEIVRKQDNFWKSIGPGLVTGAADDDPSGIATYSQAGAQIGTSILWSMPFTWPLMCAIQLVSAQIGRVTGHGLAANMRQHYGSKLVIPMVTLLLIANVLNLGADIGAMGAAANLVIGGNMHIEAVLFTLTSVMLQIFIPYHRYARILKWLTFVLFSYVGVIFFVRMPWSEVLRGTFFPTMRFDKVYITTFVALLGTTISPYLFFWQASQEVEEIDTHDDQQSLYESPQQAPLALRRIRIDTLIGMGLSNVVAYFIILATAATLHAHGIVNIDSASQAAEALRPIAGDLCSALFTIGIIGTGLLALPVLAGSAAYAVGESFGFKSSLEAKPLQAKRFYSVLAISTLLGLFIIYTKINPIQALFWTAVINGIISAPVMIVVMIMATRQKIMGQFTISRGWSILGWAATAVMTISVIIFFITL